MDSLTSANSAESIMQERNWVEVVKEIGPGFAERSAQHDQEGSFVHENYDEMRHHKLFSARILNLEEVIVVIRKCVKRSEKWHITMDQLR